MRRNAICLSASLLLVVSISGCQASQKKPAGTDSMAGSGSFATMDDFNTPAGTSTYGADTYPTYGSSAPIERTYEAPASGIVGSSDGFDAAGTRYHVVAKRDTLYGLARQYYGDHGRWKEIYEANRSVIADPNRIRIGQKLVIP